MNTKQLKLFGFSDFPFVGILFAQVFRKKNLPAKSSACIVFHPFVLNLMIDYNIMAVTLVIEKANFFKGGHHG